ncbi:hypothetical protein [Paraclostridium bifermentans]|uniref:hypothetical protein n=1 Tax=Paraclostridium bifermentans TaxID=1490 RepID=UPI001159E37C|nr:hypothetical protein [Paraclostridium bifermentans]TQO55979.1 hypothetical protein D5S05_16160 [Paraclostridium bifermentans]GKZ02732.1 hypothetical protein ANS014_11660 [Paraclostridium bifermentans]GKZ05407.1 hypothetical protein ANS015_02900 [Paraclostridium bifermentans]GKZ11434.1 hypothetical protein ANS017_28180 [Paraclostridium bifermentans]
MKIDLKNKKVQLIIGLGIAMFIGANITWTKINTNLNNMVYVSSFMIGMHDINKERKSLISEAEKHMSNNKDSQEQAQELINELHAIEKLERKELDKVESKYEDANLVNKTIDVYNKLDTNIDTFVLSYEENKDAQKDTSLARSMDSIIENEYSIDKMVKEFNEVYRVKYNNAVNSFPIKLIADKKGWVNINELKTN